MFATPHPDPIEPLLNRVLAALHRVRLSEAGLPESAIHDALSGHLASAGLPHKREFAFGPRCRADLWVEGIVIEVKTKRPPRASLLAQITRYAQQPAARALIVVLEKSIPIPPMIESKPVAVLSLNALWGIAL